ncbi:MAG: hypothetical protein ABIS23_02920 [Sphingomicrobium sp.]
MSTRRSKFAAAVLLAATAGLGPASAQPERRDETRTLTITLPQFVVHAVSFKAIDETGWDWTGSDEVHAVFADFSPIDERPTSEYDHVNAGETIAFIADDQCISPLPDCSRGRDRVRFGIALWESDFDFPSIVDLDEPDLIGAHDLYESGIDSGDDLIGRVQVGFSRIQLLGTLPNVGDVVERQIRPTGGAGSYRFTYRITRLPDVRKTVVIPVPPREP